jgi:hypothetical protein
MDLQQTATKRRICAVQDAKLQYEREKERKVAMKRTENNTITSKPTVPTNPTTTYFINDIP